MESNDDNTVYLPGLEEWGDFDRVVSAVTDRLGWRLLERFKGPDARVAEFSKGFLRFTLVYDDMWGTDIKCEGDASHLPVLAKEILAAL